MDITTLEHPIGTRTFTAGGVLGLAIFIWACDSGARSSVGTSPNAPATVPTTPSARHGELINGVVYDSGLRPIAGRTRGVRRWPAGRDVHDRRREG